MRRERRWTSAGATPARELVRSTILALAILVLGLVRTAYFNPSRSIAVLPFEDDSKDASIQHISDGITEGVINKLSEIPGLRVISRNSVFKFKGREADAQVVGRDLKVQAVLSGRISHPADGVMISAKLVNVSDGSQIWGRQFRYPFLASALTEIGKYGETIEQVQRGALLSGESPEQASAVTAEFLSAFRTGGPNGYWQKNLQATLREQELGGAGTLDLATAYARVGDKEKSLEWLQRAYEERNGDITLVNSYPDYKCLHGDPRFSALLKRMGLPD